APSTNAPGGNNFSSVAAVAAGDVWAAGNSLFDGVSQTLVENYNGTCGGPTATGTATPYYTPTPTPGCGLDWRVIASQNAGTGTNGLNAVSAVSENDIWAVGQYQAGNVNAPL